MHVKNMRFSPKRPLGAGCYEIYGLDFRRVAMAAIAHLTMDSSVLCSCGNLDPGPASGITMFSSTCVGVRGADRGKLIGNDRLSPGNAWFIPLANPQRRRGVVSAPFRDDGIPRQVDDPQRLAAA